MKIKNSFTIRSSIFLFYLIFFISCSIFKNEKVQEKNDVEVYVYKFLDIKMYVASIDESMFWDEKDIELAKVKLEDGSDVMIRDILNMKKIEQGLSENFDYAFLIKKENSTDTIYASLIQNLWTIKKDGKFIYYRDEKGEFKEILQNYHSSFFSDCW